ncbi:MAG: dephospho-CoA kinase [Ruminococcus sp.]|nr:dephospho-CoA kinase [Ruminococcus sp.]
MKRIKIIGLTGQSGAGKSYVAELLNKKQIPVINADLLVKELYDGKSPCVKTISAVFGADIIDSTGNIIRPLLAERAFLSKENTELLSSIVHPFVISLTLKKLKILAEKGEKAVIIDAPQLFESNMDIICDFIISVTADRETRIKRICIRDNISRESAEMRFNAQYEEKFFIDNSRYIIKNNGSIAELENSISLLYQDIICNLR